MAVLSDSLNELVTLAAPPGLADVRAAVDAPAPTASIVDQARALEAIDAVVDEARASGTRAAVCVAEFAGLDGASAAGGAVLDAADAWLLGRLRQTDRLYRVGATLVVVASGLGHPREGERLAERVRALPAGSGEAPVVGLAIYPTHGDDAATLLDRARTSARRADPRSRAFGETLADLDAGAPAARSSLVEVGQP